MKCSITTLAALLSLACAAPPDPLPGSLHADMEVIGEGADLWSAGGAPAAPNFVWHYETSAFRGDRAEPFHHMVTKLELHFDPEARTVSNARVTNSGSGNAFRHVCLTPAADGRLTVRMTTLLDDRSVALTAVQVHGPDPTTHTCEEYGVGPLDGLVEGIEVLFHEDGSYAVIPAKRAHLAGYRITLRRVMNVSPDPTDLQERNLPEFEPEDVEELREQMNAARRWTY